jgi:ferric-dicitrate binding protein FerR (iron transport regulator)
MADQHTFNATPELPLDRYLTGTATPAQVAQVEAWLAGDPLRARFLTELRTAGEGTVPSIDVAALSARIEQRVDALPHDGDGITPLHPHGTMSRDHRRPRHEIAWQTAWRRWAPIALGVAAIVAIGGYGGYALRSVITPTATVASQTFSTRARERATIMLSDGTRVTLAPQTTLTVASNFGASTRQVAVDGEAYFQVMHSAGAPFTVKAGGAVARVLGTSFVVRKFASDAETRVVVADGKVAVRALRAPENNVAQGVLTASTMAVISDSGAVTLTSGVSVDDYVAWTDGRLVFRATPLHDVVAELARAYGVTITATDSSLVNRQITLTAVTSRRSLTDVLDALVVIVDAHYTRRGNVITIQPGVRPAHESRWSSPLSQEKRYGR